MTERTHGRTGHAAPGAERTVTVLQGETYVSADPGEVLTTILGSCVAVCLWDPVGRVGGMNHFLLPGEAGPGRDKIKFGTHAMELLINGLLRRGAMRNRLEAKVFGGANMISQFRDIGAGNIQFARQFLRAENIPCVSESLGGSEARRIRFWPTTGQVRMLTVPRHTDTALSRAPVGATASNDITLF